MKCSDLRKQLAKLERLDRPTTEGRAHLSRCDSCRAWFQKLLRVERQVPLLPTPPSVRKAAFVHQVLAGTVAVSKTHPHPQPMRPTVARPSPRNDRDRHQQKLALATALAAGLLVFAAAFGALQWRQPDQPIVTIKQTVVPEVVKRLIKPYEELPVTASSRERIDKLIEVAGNLHQQCHELAQVPDTSDLRALAGWYSQVFRPQLLDQALLVPVAERMAVLGDIASQLDRFSMETDVVAREAPQLSRVPLLDVSAVARDTSQRLRSL